MNLVRGIFILSFSVRDGRTLDLVRGNSFNINLKPAILSRLSNC